MRPLSWPINIGAKFKGVYNIYEHSLDLFTPNKQKVTERVEISDLSDPAIDANVGEEDAGRLRNDLELIEGVYPEFSEDDYLKGEVAPVFFGSALNTFGVKELLDCFVKIAPSPKPVQAVVPVVVRLPDPLAAVPTLQAVSMLRGLRSAGRKELRSK